MLNLCSSPECLDLTPKSAQGHRTVLASKGMHIAQVNIFWIKRIFFRILLTQGSRGPQSSLLTVERKVGSITGVMQDTGYSTESSESRRSRPKRVSFYFSIFMVICIFIQNPFLSGSKSYSSSTGGEMRELEDLSETPSEYREMRDYSDSESNHRLLKFNEEFEAKQHYYFCSRGSVMSESDFTSFSGTNLSEYSARRDQKQAELTERA
jgi:hypothetical protein